MGESWERLWDIFHAALELPEDQRASFLDQNCQDNPDLRKQLDDLLASHNKSADFLETPAPRPPIADTTSSPDDIVGNRIGEFTIVRVVSEGGMGVVYEAKQEHPVQRTVALKLIKRGMDTADVIDRFNSERQALAVMNHPHIANVFDAGTSTDGRPFFAMEFVEGKSLIEYCHDEKLTVASRLALFIKICHAVQHAHQKGIIHRDLKPSNVIVSKSDGLHVPKVIDFGIAKAVDRRVNRRALATDLGELVGTPEYMSPEQADAATDDIDTRTDIYSLGAMLYQLIVDELPFDFEALRKKGFSALLQTIQNDEPRKPSEAFAASHRKSEIAAARQTDSHTLMRQIRGDLDWIITKTLEKDRHRRYDSAAELATEIERHLNHEPIVAGPPTASYRLRKFIKRHRTGVLAATFAGSALVVGLAGLSWGLLKAMDAQEEAQQAASNAQASLEFIRETLSSVDPRKSDGEEVTVRELLDRASSRAQDTFADQPGVDAAIRTTVGNSYNALGDYDVALPHFLEAWQTYKQLHGDLHPDTLAAARLVARAYLELERLDEAESLLRELIRQRVSSSEISNNTYDDLHLDLARVMRRRGLLDEAKSLATTAYQALLKDLGSQHSSTLEGLAISSEIHRDLGELEIAEQQAAKLVDARRALVGEAHLDTVKAYDVYSSVLERRGRLSDAIEIMKRSLDARKRVQGDDHPDTLTTMGLLAKALIGADRMEEALPFVKQTYDVRKVIFGEEHSLTLTAMNNLAVAYIQLGRPANAEALWTETLVIMERVFGLNHLGTITTMKNLAKLKKVEGRAREAEVLFVKSMEQANEVFPEGHWLRGYYRGEYADCLTDLGQFHEAERYLLESHETLASSPNANPKSRLNILSYLPRLYESWGRNELAGKHWQALRESAEESADDQFMKTALVGLGTWHYRQGDYQSARDVFTEAMELVKGKIERRIPHHLVVRARLGRTLLQLGKREEAHEHIAWATQRAELELSPGSPYYQIVRAAHAHWLTIERRYPEAHAILDEAHSFLSARADTRADTRDVRHDLLDLCSLSGESLDCGQLAKLPDPSEEHRKVEVDE